MGLLSRASQELAQPAAGPSRAGGLGLSLPRLNEEEARNFLSGLPRQPLLGLRCPLEALGSGGAAGEGGSLGPELAAALSRALGPEARLYLSRTFLIVLALPRGDWDPELFELQLRRVLPPREGGAKEGLALELRRFEPGTTALEGELLAFAGA